MPSEDLSNQSPLPSTARRRLLRGVVAGATVLPVGAGAQAVASNLRCVANIVGPHDVLDPVTGGRTKFKTENFIVRIPLYRSRWKDTSVTPNIWKFRWWVRGSDLIALKNNKLLLTPAGLTNSSYLLSKSDLAADVAGSFVANKNATYNGPNAGWSQPTQLDTSSNERFVAVRFDKDGNILGTSDYISSFSAPVNNSAVHRTCWASFSGLTIQQLS